MGLNLNDKERYPEQQEFEALPAGLYLANVDNVELKKSREKQIPMFNIKYRIMSGPEGAEAKNAKNRIVFENFMTNVDWRMGNLRSLVIATGVDDEGVLGDFDKKYGAIINRPVKIRLKVAKRNDDPDKDTNEVIPGNYYAYKGPALPDSVSESSGESKPAPQEAGDNDELPFN